MSTLRGEASPRDILLRRAAAALAAAVALGLAALLLGTRVESGSGEGGERRASPEPPAFTAARADKAETTAAFEGAGGLPAVAPAATGGAVAGTSPVLPAESPTAAAETVTSVIPLALPLAPAGVVLPEAAVAASGPGHRIQLGVFGEAANAVSVYERAVAAGYDARIQSRVVVGPFADKAAAERAQRKLREAGLGAGVIVPPARTN